MSAAQREESPRADRSVAGTFLDALGGGEFTFQTFDDNTPRKDRRLVRVLHGTIDQYFTLLEHLNGRGAGIFVTVNRTDGKGRDRNNIVGIRALFVDLDGAPLAPAQRWALTPHLVIESSPNRFHVYWLVDRTVALTDFGAFQKKLAKLFGGDASVHDLPRVLRLPGFVHRKAEPFCTGIVRWNGSLPRYSASEFNTALADIRVNEVARLTQAGAPVIEPDQPANIRAAVEYLRRDAAPAIAFEHGNCRTYETACFVRGRFGLSVLACFDLMLAHFNPRCDPPWSLEELEAIVAHAYRYAQGALGGESAEADFASDPLPTPSEAPVRFGTPAFRPSARINRRRAVRRSRAMAFGRE